MSEASQRMMLAASAIDLLVLYLGLELVTLCSYILVGITVEKPASNEAAIKYFLLGSFASALLLYGIALTYGVTGSTDFAAIAGTLDASGLLSNPILLAVQGHTRRNRYYLHRHPYQHQLCRGLLGCRLQGRWYSGAGTGLPGRLPF